MPNRQQHSKLVRVDNRGQLLLEFPDDLLPLLSPDDIFESASEELLLALKEDRRIERKPSNYCGEPLGEYFSMWGNTLPDGGLISLGQENAGAFEGCTRLSSEAINQREKVGMVFCPDAKYEVKRVPVRNKGGELDFIILFRVNYHPDVVVRTTKGKVFVRKGDSKIELKPDEIRELQADKGEIRFEQQPCHLRWPIDFDLAAVRQFVDAVRVKRGMSDSLTVEEVLDLRHLGKLAGGDFHPSVACALLFASDPISVVPGCKVRFQRFEGEFERTGEEYNAVKDDIFEGTVQQLIRSVESALESQLRTFSPLNKRMKFVPVPEYPKPAWYEAIVNACVHRSYGNGLKNVPIFVKMFDDRLVIESPGRFPPFVTPQNIYNSHTPRNPSLMDAMFYLQYVRCEHEGTKRMRKTMTEMELPAPEFKVDEHGPPIVVVTLRNNVKQRRAWIDRDVSKIISGAIAADFSEDERRIVNFVAENGSTTVNDTVKSLKISWQKARRLLMGLASKRVFQYVRFRPFQKNLRDPRAFYRLRSAEPLPDGAFEAFEPENDK